MQDAKRKIEGSAFDRIVERMKTDMPTMTGRQKKEVAGVANSEDDDDAEAKSEGKEEEDEEEEEAASGSEKEEERGAESEPEIPVTTASTAKQGKPAFDYLSSEVRLIYLFVD